MTGYAGVIRGDLYRRWVLGGALLAMSLPILAWSESFFVDAEVVGVEPVIEARVEEQEVGLCAPLRPETGDLLATLAWDLRPDCERISVRTEETVAWRVRYAWDGREHTVVLDEEPGEVVALEVSLY